MKRVGKLWDKIVSYDNLLLAHKKARKGKTNKTFVKEFEKDVEGNLLKLQQALINRTFTTSAYQSRIITEPKLREIFLLPYYPDRIVQHAIMNVLEETFDRRLIYQTTSCRKGKGIDFAFKLARKYVRRNKFCLKGDISKFYPSIDHDKMMIIIKSIIKCDRTVALIADIVYSYRKQYGSSSNVPIGNFTSQWLGNLFLNILDRFSLEYFKVDYIRYCDDFIFFSNDYKKLKRIKRYLPLFLKSTRGLRLSKSNLLKLDKSALDFVGYRFYKSGKILLRRSTLKRVVHAIKHCNYILANNGHLSKRLVGSIVAYNSLFKRCNSAKIKEQLDFTALLEYAKAKQRMWSKQS